MARKPKLRDTERFNKLVDDLLVESRKHPFEGQTVEDEERDERRGPTTRPDPDAA